MAKKVGSVYAELRARLDKYERDLKKAHGQTISATTKIQKSINRINFDAPGKSFAKFQKILGAGLAGVGMASFTRNIIKAASDLEETASKFNVVFAGQEEMAKKWANTLVESYNVSTREAKQYLASIQDLLVPMGMQAEAAGLMSNEIVKLSADLASFNNLETPRVMSDIQSALVGNFETMKKYGVVLTASSVKQRIFNEGLAESEADITAADKALAAYNIILEMTQAAQGDVARTNESYANTLKRVTARFEDLSAKIGTIFLPVASKLLQFIIDIDEKMDEVLGGKAPDTIENLFISQTEAQIKHLELLKRQYEGLGEEGNEALDNINGRLERLNRLLESAKVDRSLTDFFKDIDTAPRSTGSVTTAGTEKFVTFGTQTRGGPVRKSKPYRMPGVFGVPGYPEDLAERMDESFREMENMRRVEEQIVQYGEVADTTFTRIDERVGTTVYNMTDAITNFAQTGKISFKSFAQSIISDLIRIQARASLTGLFGKAIGMLTPSFAPAHIGAGGTTAFGMQHGGYLGEGVVGVGKRSGQSYEFHPNEYLVPGDKMGGGGDVIINNYSGMPATKQYRDINGRKTLMVNIGNDVLSGGPMDQAIRLRYGLQPAGKLA